MEESVRSSSPEATESEPLRHPRELPAEHRRNRKSWSSEELQAFWKKKKMEKKQRKKTAAAERKAAQQEEWETLDEETKEERRRAAVEVHDARRLLEEAHQQTARNNLATPTLPTLVFDLSFAWCMTVADTKSTVAQLKLSYSALRRAAFPFRPVFTSLCGRELEDLEHTSTAQGEVLKDGLMDFAGFRAFPPQRELDRHWKELYPAERVVFLTADAEEILDDVEDSTIYVVGAFVDHNQYKGLSKSAAVRHGVRTARLPLQERVDLGNRCKILTINHVVDLLTQYMANGRDWTSAIETVLPVRRVQQEELGSRKRRRQLQGQGDGGSSTTSVEEHQASA